MTGILFRVLPFVVSPGAIRSRFPRASWDIVGPESDAMARLFAGLRFWSGDDAGSACERPLSGDAVEDLWLAGAGIARMPESEPDSPLHTPRGIAYVLVRIACSIPGDVRTGKNTARVCVCFVLQGG